MTSQYDDYALQSRYSANTETARDSADVETAQATSSMELPTARERLLTEARQYQKIHYALVTRVSAGELLLLNNGYEEDPPMALPLSASDEPDRFGLQLYHRTAARTATLIFPVSWPKCRACCAREGISYTPMPDTPTKLPPGRPHWLPAPCGCFRRGISVLR